MNVGRLEQGFSKCLCQGPFVWANNLQGPPHNQNNSANMLATICILWCHFNYWVRMKFTIPCFLAGV